MPVDALPIPPRSAPEGTATLRRVYRDPLGRPMTGTVTITGQTRHATGDVVTLAAPVTVTVTGGLLEVQLPPDTYTVAAALRTADGARVNDQDTVTVP